MRIKTNVCLFFLSRLKLTEIAGKRCWVWDCCINPQVLRDAIAYRQVKTILIQTCLNLVEEREDIVLSRQFTLPKMTAKGQLEQTRVPKAMFNQPTTITENTDISSILENDQIMPDLHLTPPPPPSSAKPLIQEISSSSTSFTFKIEPHSKSPFSLFNIFGCSQNYVDSASVSYLPWSHQVFLQSSSSSDTLYLTIPENLIPKKVHAFYVDALECLRIVIE